MHLREQNNMWYKLMGFTIGSNDCAPKNVLFVVIVLLVACLSVDVFCSHVFDSITRRQSDDETNSFFDRAVASARHRIMTGNCRDSHPCLNL